MLGTLARSVFLLFLAVMLVSWALSLGKSEPAAQQGAPAVYYQFV